MVCGLNAATLCPTCERVFTGVVIGDKRKKTNLIELVKGGRWLLVTESTGAATYYDLDSDAITGVELIPNQLKFGVDSETLMSVDYETHRNSPFLEFIIALFVRVLSDSHASTMHIWRVGSVLDDKQHVVGLKATLLASFPHRSGMSWVKALSLLGPNVAFVCMAGRRQFIIVVDWGQANANPLNYPWKFVSSSPPSRVSDTSFRIL